MEEKMIGPLGKVFKRNDGRYVGQYTVEGRQKSVYGKTPKEVKVKYQDLVLNFSNAPVTEVISTGKGALENNPKQTLGEWLTEWLNDYVKLSVRPATYINYEVYVNRHIIPHIGSVPLDNMSVKTFQDFLNLKSKSGRLDNKPGGMSAKSILNMCNMLNTAIQQAVDNELITKNPIHAVRKIKSENKEMRVLSTDEQLALINACRAADNISAFGIIVTLYTGLRIGELLALTWDSIDLSNNVLTVKQSIARLKLFDDMAGTKTQLKTAPPKTSKGKREVNLLDGLVDDISAYKEKQKILLYIR
jgi:integrase